MKRIVGVLFAFGLGVGSAGAQGVGSAGAQDVALKPPRLSARATCPPSLQARCSGITQRGMDHDVACDRCAADVMPADIASSPERVSTPAKIERPPECMLGLMPLGVTAPGCLRPPVDNIPVP